VKTIVSLSLYIGVCVAIALLGVGAGWQMAQQKAGGGGGHGHGDHGHDAHAEESSTVSAQALENLGGRVLSVAVELGQLAAPGDLVVTVLRQPFPRPTLEMTTAVLTPATEDYHQAKAELRKALKSAEILQQELQRLGAFEADQGLPLVPRQNMINLRYEQAKSLQDIENLRTELRMHGLSDAELAKIESGVDVPLNRATWRVLLQRNGLWSTQADALMAALPEALSSQPWTVAVIAELALQQLANSGLAEWLSATPEAGEQFYAIAGLMQGGATLAHVQDLYAMGAFASEVRIRVPEGAEDWDVRAIEVRPGDIVEAGTDLLTLADARRLQLVAQPSGSEVASVLAALRSSQTSRGEPLVAGSGPELNELALRTLTVDADGHPVAYLDVSNSELRTVEREGRRFRSWALRPGLRYMLMVPVETLENVIVIPVTGIVEEGADKQVFIRNGKSFSPAKVVLLHRDHKVAVLGGKSEVFPGDDVVISGAFALKLALNAGKDGADPHAGHGHPH
jgi:hypothetical protein